MSNKQHRYLVITELFLPTKGGTAVWFDEVYRRIGGKEIHIVTADVPGASEHDADHKNTIHRVSLRRHWWLKPESLSMYIKLFSKSLSIALRNKIDAIHAGRVLPEGLIGWIVARIIRKPIVVYAHGEEITTWRQAVKFRVMRFVYRHADRVVANSEFTQTELQKLGVKAQRIKIIYPGVDINRFKPGLMATDLAESIELKNNQKLILSVGRLSRRKGFDQVVKSLPALLAASIDVQYAIIGIGEDYDYLQSIACEMEVSERVHFLGHVNSDDLPRWYNIADIFAMPNREINGDTEGFGMVFIEAGACSRPVIAGLSGGTGSSVINEETGLRVDGESLKDITYAFIRLLTDKEEALGMADRAYHRAIQDFSWDSVAVKTANLLNEKI